MINSQNRVFVIMPFSEDFLELYEMLKKEFDASFSFTNAGDLDNQQNILKDIVEGIYNAEIVIADLTGLNPNVFYELGLAHAMHKKVIILTQDIGELPFDIKSYRAVQYSLKFFEIPKLVDELRKLLDGAIDGSVKYGNPVSDYCPNALNTENGISSSSILLVQGDGEQNNEDYDKGFLDFINDIQESSEKMTTEIVSMNEEMSEMSSAVNRTSSEIDRVKSNGNTLDPSFARSICRKLSTPVDEFAMKLNGHVSEITANWNIIENGYLSLIDNRFVQTSENVEGLKKSIYSLDELKFTIHDTDGKMSNFADILRVCIGIERKLSKALTSLVEGIENYLEMTSTISSSIDRIKTKAELTINNIV